jgi:hypothetical protein
MPQLTSIYNLFRGTFVMYITATWRPKIFVFQEMTTRLRSSLTWRHISPNSSRHLAVRTASLGSQRLHRPEFKKAKQWIIKPAAHCLWHYCMVVYSHIRRVLKGTDLIYLYIHNLCDKATEIKGQDSNTAFVVCIHAHYSLRLYLIPTHHTVRLSEDVNAVAYARDWSVVEGRIRSGSSWFSPVLPANANTMAKILIYPRLQTFPHFKRHCKAEPPKRQKAQAAAQCRIATTMHSGVLSPHGPRTSFYKLWLCACVCVHTHINDIYRDFAQWSTQNYTYTSILYLSDNTNTGYNPYAQKQHSPAS